MPAARVGAAGRTCPVYLVCESVDGPDRGAWIQDVRAALMDVADHFARRPALEEAVRVSVLTFGEQLDVMVPLSGPSSWRPGDLRFRSGGTVSYAAMFPALRDRLHQDEARLGEAGLLSMRPVVLLAVRSGPEPGDEWEPGWRQLVDLDDSVPDLGRFPLVASVCRTGDAVPFAGRVSYPPRVGRRYEVASPERFADAVSTVLRTTSQRLLDVGGGDDSYRSLLPGEDDLRGAATVSDASADIAGTGLGAGTVAGTDPGPVTAGSMLELPAAPPSVVEPADAVTAPVPALPERFFFDPDRRCFVPPPAPGAYELTRREVEEAVTGFLMREFQQRHDVELYEPRPGRSPGFGL